MDGSKSCGRCGGRVGNNFMVGVAAPYQLDPQDLCLCPCDGHAVERVMRALAQRGFGDLDQRTMALLWLSPTDGPFDLATFNHHVGTALAVASGRIRDLTLELCKAGYLRFDTSSRCFEMTCRGRLAWLLIRTSYE